MADVFDWYFEHLVLSADLDEAFGNLENADRVFVTDQDYFGVYNGLNVTQQTVPDLTVQVGVGTAYDQQGARVRVPAVQNVDLSVDSNASSTTVVGASNTKWVSLFLRFSRTLSGQRFDGNGSPVFFRRDEGFEFVVVQGAEAASSPARPALLSDGILIADVLLSFGTTQITDAIIESSDIATDPTSRFQFAFNLTSSSPATVRVGPLPDAMQAILTELNNHVSGVSSPHPASAINFTPVGNLIATDVQTALSELDADLTAIFANDNVWAGEQEYTGDVSFSGPGTVTVDADSTLNGAVDITGEASLTNFIDVGGSLATPSNPSASNVRVYSQAVSEGYSASRPSLRVLHPDGSQGEIGNFPRVFVKQQWGSSMPVFNQGSCSSDGLVPPSLNEEGDVRTTALLGTGGLGTHVQYDTLGTSGDLAGIECSIQVTRRVHEPVVGITFQLEQSTDQSVFVGLSETNLTSMVPVSVLPSSLNSYCGVRMQTDNAETSLLFVTCDGAGNVSTQTTGITAVNATSNPFMLIIDMTVSGEVRMFGVNRFSGAVRASHVFTTDLPSNTADLRWMAGLRNNDNSVRTFNFAGMNIVNHANSAL